MSDTTFNAVYIDGSFIKKYIGSVPEIYISVYICAKSTGISDAEYLSKILSADILKVSMALEFWNEKGVIISQEKKQKKLSFDERPTYYAQELQIYADKNPYIRQMFDSAQKHLGRLLTHSDLSAIFGFHHWLGLDADAVDLLLEYCTSKGHRNMRYIERVAIDWAENGITTKDKAIERIHLYNNDFRQIMRAMGQSSRNPIDTEEKIMKKWVEEYKMPMDVIELACEKTVMNTGKASFGYADKIITNWKNSGITTLDGVKAEEEKFAKERYQKAENTAPKTSAPKTNNGSSIYDFSLIEKLEMENLRKENE